MNLPPQTPEACRDLRLRLGLTQKDIADKAHLGAPVRWSEYEQGRSRIDTARWELVLLKTDQHPTHKLVRRK